MTFPGGFPTEQTLVLDGMALLEKEADEVVNWLDDAAKARFVDDRFREAMAAWSSKLLVASMSRD